MRKIRSGTASSVTCKSDGSVEIIAPGGILNAAGTAAVVVDADIAAVTVLANTAQTTANTAQTTANSAISDASAAQTTANAAVPTATKDATGGVAGLTLFRINFKNAANTFTSFFTNAATAARTYTFPNKDITVAGLDDIAAKQDADSDLTAIAALNSATGGAIASDGAGWIQKTYTQFKTALGLVKADVGLPLVDNIQQLPLSYLDTDINLAANSDAKVPSQKAIKAYTDALMQGLYPKASVRAISTTNITLSAAQTIDGVAIIAGDRVLVAGQTTGADNGIYLCAAGAWTRATDADVSAEVKTGIFTFVSEGTTNADSGWTLITNDPITLGTTALVFTQFSGAGQITAGAALTKAGNVLDVAVDGVGIEINADALRLKDAGATNAKLANMVTATFKMRVTGTTGAPEDGTAAQAKTALGLDLVNNTSNATERAATATLTNKRIEPRIVSAASYTTDTGTSLDVSTTDLFVITAQAGALLFNSPGGTPVQGQKLMIRIKDNATARALTWNAVFRPMGTALPSTTVLSKTLYLGFIYNSTDAKFDLVASAQEA